MTDRDIRRLIRCGLDAMKLEAAAQDAYMRMRYQLDRESVRRNRDFREEGPPDGLPIPPAAFAYAANGRFDLRLFYEGGKQKALQIGGLVEEAGRSMRDLDGILDFGCGSGRVLRHFQNLPAMLTGTDVNPRLVRWCRANLPIAQFYVNAEAPPLPLDDGSVALAYAISVFTHLPEPMQRPWLEELVRVVPPGGLILFTTHGTSRLRQLSSAEQAAFGRSELVVQGANYPYSNHLGTFHPKEYVTGVLAPDLDLLRFADATEQAEEGDQDMYLFGTV